MLQKEDWEKYSADCHDDGTLSHLDYLAATEDMLEELEKIKTAATFDEFKKELEKLISNRQDFVKSVKAAPKN